MRIVELKRGEIKLVGLSVRTNNANEANPETAQIGATIQRYFSQNWAEHTLHRAKPGVLYSVYTEYEDGVNGDYTYCVGEEVTSFEEVPGGATVLTIPAQNYVVFTNGPGPMPDVCIQTWQHIWCLNDEQLGGKRAYLADFEVYDERAFNPAEAVLDVYVGVE